MKNITKTTNRKAMLLVAFVVALLMAATPAMAQTYQKVTSAPADGDWTGTYVIGYGSQIFGGTVSSYHGSTADITVSGGTITSDVADQCLVYISKAGTMASGTHAGENYYLVTFYQNNIWKSFTYSGSGLTTSSRSSSYSNSGSTSAEHVTSITNPERWYISFSSGKITLETTQSSGYYFMYSNYTTGSEYFYLTNSTAATSHKDLTIYKQVEDNNCSSGVYNQFLSATPYSGTKFHDEMPYAFAQKNSFNQIVYSKDLNIPQYIESIGFMYFHAASNVNISQKSKVIIYIGDTDASTYSDWVDVRDLTKVYEGPMNFNYAVNKKWQFTDFTFNQLDNCGGVYTHNTSKNLVVVIHDDSNVAESIGNRGFFYRTASNGVHLHNYSTNQIAVSEETGKPYIVSSGSDLSASSTANYPVAHFCGKDHWWQPYQVTTIPAENGSFTVLPDDDEVCENATVDLSATPDPNYDFVGFTVTRDSDGTEVPVTVGHPVTECQFVMPDDDVTITATFTPHIYDNTRYLKKTDIDEAQWAGKYILGYFGGEGGPYAATSTVNGSNQLTGTAVTMSADYDTIKDAQSSKVYSIEYGGLISGQTGGGTIHNGHPYYFIYYYDPSDGSKKYLRGSGTTTLAFGTFTEDRPTADSYKWCFYENGGNFLMRNFYGSIFLKSLNSTSNHHTEPMSGTVPTGPSISGSTCFVYLYRWDTPTYAITTSATGNGTLNVYGEAMQHSTGSLAYEGTTIVFRPVPESGYSLSYLRVTDSENNEVSCETTSAGTFQFTMPDDEVTIYAEFAEQECTDATVSGATGAVEENDASSYCKMPYPIRSNYGYKQYIYSDANSTDKLPSVITSIGFMYYKSANVNIENKNHVEVYLSDTESETLSDWVDINSQTKVYEGPMNFAYATDLSNWKDFAFNSNGGKFIHDKTKNLVVTVIDRSGANNSGQTSRGFYTVNEGKVVSLSARGDYDYTFDGSGKPLSNGSSVTGTGSNYHPSTHFCGANVYYVTCATGLANGSISASPNNSLTGDGTETVTITAEPATGYELNTITATNETTGTTIALSGSGNTRTFTMPAANVSVTATFRLAGGGGDTWVDNVTSQPAGYVVDGSGNVTISSAEGLAWLISVVNGGESLSGKTVNLDADLDMDEHIWVPIGYSSTAAFAGTFNGNNHTISNLHIASAEISDVETAAGSTMQYTGLFGYTDGATIKNVVLTNDCEFANNNASGSIGSIVGYANGGTIEFCQSEATLTAAGNITAMGGMVGTAASTNVNGVTSLVSMAHGENNVTSVGGVVGTGGTVKTYIANNTISGTGTVTNKSAVANSATVSNGYVLSTNSGYTVASGTGYAPGDYTAVTPYTYGSNSNTVGNVPMVNMLNSGTPATNMAWKQAKGTRINGGYPIIVRTDDAVPMGCVKNGNLLRHDDVNTLLTAAASTDTVFMYGSGAITLSSAPSCKFYIDEDAALTQANDIAINATVGITFDNTAGNGEKSRDWHAFSSALTAASIGISYGGSQVHAYGANDLPLEGAAGFSLVQNNAAVYLPNGITVANSCDGTEFDLYAYSEPNYHWVNMKRETDNHYYEDTHAQFDYTNETTYTPGHGYFIAIGDNSTKNYNLLQANGTLNNGTVGPISVTHNGAHLSGYNLLGNPYQSYLDFNEFASVNGSALWGEGVDMGYKAYLIYDADIDGFDEYLVDENGTSFSQGSLKTASRYIHPHQGFFVLKKEGEARDINFTNAMRVTSNASAYRDAQPSYPLVNLVCTDSEGKQEITVIEFERPATAGSLKMKGMLNSKGNLYIHYNNEDFGSMFLNDMPEMLPLWFRALEDGVFTLSWSTANGVFSNLHLIDNLTGADIDCNAAQSYTFESRQSDSKARFRLVFTPYGIEEETAEGESFAFISNGELIVTGNGELSLIDLNGRVLTTEHIAGEQSRISVPAVAEGMYLLRLAGNNGVKMQKIVIRR